MIANDKESPLEVAVKMITAPVWVPDLLHLRWLSQGGRGVVEAQAEVGRARAPGSGSAATWQPSREFERAVYAALILAGEAVNNLPLGGVDGLLFPGEASRRVAQLEGVIRKARKGREVLISLN